MATYTYTALVIQQEPDSDPQAAEMGTLSISASWPLQDLVYIDPDPDDGNVGGLQRTTIRINGELVLPDASGLMAAELVKVDWSGGSAILFAVEYAGQIAFALVDGDDPGITDLATLTGFLAQDPEFSRVTSGDWAPGEMSEYDPTFLLGGLASLIGFSQDDDYVNTLTGIGGQGRFRMRDGDDRFTGSDWREEVYGGNGDDTLSGNDGNDTIYGDAGADRVFGGAGQDSLLGGDGGDRIEGGTGTDYLFGDLGNDSMYGDEQYDELFGNEGSDRMWGGRGSDVLWGEAGKDRLFGDTGNDWLDGGEGDDQLDGGRGVDQLTGGLGADRFTFRSGSGRDVVTDFSVAEGDTLALDAALVGGNRSMSDAQVIALYAFDLGDAVLFDFGGGQMITLFGVAAPGDLDGSITLI